ncbi:flagellar basal-body rod protein FlgF [Hansschlegelia quercus]|uniref:Flagellar basal-body rod protein FlgF n=1 Tax=Hansschlegelia quercus TaxID=2528245 RepID=A0A4Q9GL62_9HYPH|nr:flagellar basal-body rod protein FlgF [Hansschlegelia quercus]TBN55063.1 flagellar basal-body rod protein FlgF [Hansschlegelia quercus]
MENASLVGLSRQVVLQRELDVISNNVANMNTAGFKAEQMSFEEFVSPKARDNNFARRDRPLSFVEDRATWHDFSGGVVQTTGSDTDVAIDGEGFFVVEAAGGQRYTRNGAFQINARGELVTNEGARVMSTSGPIQLGPTETGLSISKDGTIATSEGIRGRLKVALFDNLQAMTKAGGSLFSTDAQPTDATTKTTRLIQGAVEKSNVRPVVEMSRLVEVTRSYSTVSAMLDKQDDIRRTAIERLADVPA